MGLHLLPFVVGAATGAVATYILKDEPTQKRLKEGARQIGAGVGKTVSAFTPGRKEEPEAIAKTEATSGGAEGG